MRKQTRPARSQTALATAEVALPAALPLVEAQPAQPAGGRDGKPDSISAHLGNFKRTGNPVSLLKAGSRCYPSGADAGSAVWSALFSDRPRLAGHGRRAAGGVFQARAQRYAGRSPRDPAFDVSRRSLRRQFPVHLLPPDLVTYTHIFAHGDDWMVVGEYAESARMYYLNRDSCTLIPYYTNIEAVRHIHSVHRLSDTQVARLDGRQGQAVRSLGRRRVGDDVFQATHGPQRRFSFDAQGGRRRLLWHRFHPSAQLPLPLPGRQAVVLSPAGVHEIRAPPAGGGRSVSRVVERGLSSLGGDRAWTVFDTHREEFIHAASLGKLATKTMPSAHPARARRRSPAFGLPLPGSLAGSSPALMQ